MVNTDVQTALDRALTYPLLEALANRRSRRFSLGAKLPGGGLAYESQKAPLPLSKMEEAVLAFAASGLTGLCLGDLPYAAEDEHEAGGGNVIATLTGRAAASADAVHGTAVFVINDEATYLLKRPQDFSYDEVDDLARLGRERRF